MPGRHAGGGQLRAIEPQQHRQMRAGGMTHKNDAIGVAAIVRNVIDCPAHSARSIVDECREDYLWVDAIIGDHGDETFGGERFADESIIVAGPSLPSSTVEEHDDRRLWLAGRVVGDVEIEALP